MVNLSTILNSKMGRLLESAKGVQITVFILVVLLLSFGQIARWDLLDQISMADRYNASGYFYPDKFAANPSGVSVYFPGVALLASLLSTIVPAGFVVQAMLVLACLFTMAFLLLQREIAKDIDKSYKGEAFWPLAIIFSLFFAKEWLIYAVEFKPDTIAFVIGGASLLLSRRKRCQSGFCLTSVFFGLTAGLALAFKQQYIAFIFGYLIFFLVSKRKEDFLFLLGCLATSIIFLCFMKANSNAWFWTVNVLADDGFLGYKQWAKDHFLFFSKVALLFCAVIAGANKKIITLICRVLSKYISTPWPVVISCGALAAFMGSWKVGGNAGNTAFGLMLAFPLVLLMLSKINERTILLAGWLVLGLQIPSVINQLKSYKQADELIQAVMEIHESDCQKILTGSDVYLATRSKFLNCDTTNYWTISLRDNTKITDDIEFKRSIESREFKYIIAENFKGNNAILKNSGNYQILFENKLGIVAKMVD